MNFDEALAKRNEAREIRNKSKKELKHFFDDISSNALVEKLQNSEYNWGYWDGVITVMKNNGLKEIST